jgi:hypothetical protein
MSVNKQDDGSSAGGHLSRENRKFNVLFSNGRTAVSSEMRVALSLRTTFQSSEEGVLLARSRPDD